MECIQYVIFSFTNYGMVILQLSNIFFLIEKDLGFLRIGSLNVRVKRTTEAFSNFLGVGSNDKIHKHWGSADNLPQVCLNLNYVFSIFLFLRSDKIFSKNIVLYLSVLFVILICFIGLNYFDTVYVLDEHT